MSQASAAKAVGRLAGDGLVQVVRNGGTSWRYRGRDLRHVPPILGYQRPPGEAFTTVSEIARYLPTRRSGPDGFTSRFR